LVALSATVAFLAAAPSANAAIAGVFTNTPTPIPCTVQGNGVRLCDQTTFSPARTRSTVKTFDGVPIDVRVAFPPVPAMGPDGPYPLIMLFHGYAGSKLALSSMQPWLDRGYATLSMTTRGFGESCGTSAARSADTTGCAAGYVRLMDTRYEVRDAQEFAGLLADEGHTSATQIGAIGGSYGGGMSMALAALKNRKMLTNGTLVPWTSPLGTPMRIAAATPEIPWTDLPYSLLPNGSTLDYLTDAPYQGRTGVLKESWEGALYNAGLPFFYAAAGADPDADLRNWHTLFNNGEPYDDASGNPLPAVAAVHDELSTHHSSYSIDHSQAPAPLLVSNGWTDDLFPVDEAIRYYNRTRAQYPNADISLFLGSFGHQRGQNKAADLAQRTAAEQAWMDYYVKGVGGVPFHGVQTLTQTCPSSAASGGPFSAPNWGSIAPGEISFSSAAPQTILPTAGDPGIGFTFDPITFGDACATVSAADQANTATYRLAAAPAGGFTLMGSPTVIADITSAGSNSQIAARLLDVDTGTNQETLVARGLWRPAISASPVHQVFQLHPSGYKFAAGHIAKLELLPNDNPYGRVSNGQANVTIQNLELRLPVLEQPGTLGGLVQLPASKLVPAGRELAPDFGAYTSPIGASPLRVSLVPAYQACETGAADSTHGSPLNFPSCSGPGLRSSTVTVGPHSIGFARMVVCSANAGSTFCTPSGNAMPLPDVRLTGSIRDVKCASSLPGGQSACSSPGVDYNPNGAPGPYTSGGDGNSAAQPPCFPSGTSTSACVAGADLTEVADFPAGTQGKGIRITAQDNGTFGTSPATVVDSGFPIPLDCVTTTDPSAGSNCGVNTTANALVPGVIKNGKGAVWQIGQIEIKDSGPDGVRASADDQVFEVQGVFLP